MAAILRRLAAALLLIAAALPAAAFDTSAKAAYVIDITTGTVLLEKNAEEPLPPASMSKLMTLYVAFEAAYPDSQLLSGIKSRIATQ